jgi:hypothetical protein
MIFILYDNNQMLKWERTWRNLLVNWQPKSRPFLCASLYQLCLLILDLETNGGVIVLFYGLRYFPPESGV